MIGQEIETTAALSFCHVLDRVAAPIFIQDRHARVVFVNRALVARSRYTAAQLLEGADRVFSAELRDDGGIFTRETDVIQTGYLHDANGQAQAVSVVKSIVHDADGNPFVIGTIEDSINADRIDRARSEIERQQAEVALLKSEQRLSMLIQHAPMGIIEWTPEFTAKEWNPAAEKIFKTPRSQAIGRNGNCWVPEQDQAKVNQIIKTLFEQQGEIHSINQNLRDDGEIIVCEWYNSQILDADGNVTGVVAMVRDISDRIRLEAEREQADLALKQSDAQLRQQAQELESAFKQLQKTQAQLIQNEKMSSLGQLVAGIAHEINNPVSFIYGNVEHAKDYIEDLLRIIQLYQADHPVPSEQIAEELEDLDLEFVRHDLMKLLDSMGTGAERIRDIVRSLRHFSRHDEADLKAVDLHEGIESALMLLQHLLKSNRACGSPLLRPTIQIVKDYGALPKIQCYAGLLNQVFINVLSNAIGAINERWLAEEIDFTPEITVQTVLFQQSDSTEWARISITDNGIGMTAATQRRLFDPFFTTKPVGQGSGLGLSVSYQIVTEQHGGRLSCDRPSKRGATFVIEIPVRQLMWS
ncbi:PAS domain S-box protein [Leptolyngbya sp. DQ-M1]|uniref:PAS domain-containing sensor histidine kinase n=1 Tax=Leptolyngbya sp. DQ-M1 TaxID=2933920 RepID=UPI003297DF61